MPNYTPIRNVLTTLEGRVQSLETDYRTVVSSIAGEPALQIAPVNAQRRKVLVAIASLKANVRLLRDEVDILDSTGGQAATLAPIRPTVANIVRLLNDATEQVRTMTVLSPGLASPNVQLPYVNDRPVIDMKDQTGSINLTTADRIYDFGGAAYSAARDIRIHANNVEARNIRGTGSRRVGRGTTDSGFRDAQYTYCQIDSAFGSGDTTRPYWVDCFMLDYPGTRFTYSWSPVQLYAYHGNIIEPLFRNFTVYGYDVDPSGVDPHCDSMHLTSASGSNFGVVSPTFDNVDSYSGGSLGVLYRHTSGTVTVKNSTFRRRFGAGNAFQLNADDVPTTVTLLWQNNTLPQDNPPSAYSAVAFGGVAMHPDSDATINSGFIIN